MLTVDGISIQSCSNINLDRALIWYWDHLKNFITEIPQGPGTRFGHYKKKSLKTHF